MRSLAIRVTLVLVCATAVAAPQTASAASVPSGFIDNVVAAGLNAPTAMALAPDGRIFVAEQGGAVRVIKAGVLLPTPFVTLNVDSAGERGVIGVAFDPQFDTNGFVYIHYTVPGGAGPSHNRVGRFTASGDVAVPGSLFVLVDLDDLSGATNHNGGAIHFGPDGKLYIGVGENANGANSQTLSNRKGKVLRLNKDGSIPSDNPFAATATGVNRAIWALGLRNPFTFAFEAGTTRLLHQRRRTERVGGDRSWRCGIQLRMANDRGRDVQPCVPIAAPCVRPRNRTDARLCHCRRHVRACGRLLSGVVRRRLLFCGSVRGVDQQAHVCGRRLDVRVGHPVACGSLHRA